MKLAGIFFPISNFWLLIGTQTKSRETFLSVAWGWQVCVFVLVTIWPMLQSNARKVRLLLNKVIALYNRPQDQCDKIGRFIRLWASFWSLRQQLISPKSPTFLGNFYHYWATFIDIWRFFSGHTAQDFQHVGTLFSHFHS